MSLLREIQDAAVDGKLDAGTLLRKCRVLAQRLNNDLFTKWVLSELNGYQLDESLPPYRVFSVQSLGDFAGGFGSNMRNIPLPLGLIPEQYRQMACSVAFREGVVTLSELAASTTGGSLEVSWPADLVRAVGRCFYRDYVLLGASRSVPTAMLKGIVETVRNRVLEFVLQIEVEDPRAGESTPGVQPISTDKVTNVFNNYIMGNVSNLAPGASNFSQHASMTVITNDWSSLVSVLNAVGIPKADAADLKKALAADGAPVDGKFGTHVADWVGRVVTKGAQGAFKIGTAAATALLIKALEQYLGITPHP